MVRVALVFDLGSLAAAAVTPYLEEIGSEAHWAMGDNRDAVGVFEKGSGSGLASARGERRRFQRGLPCHRGTASAGGDGIFGSSS
jgi:hypothetical protein